MEEMGDPCVGKDGQFREMAEPASRGGRGDSIDREGVPCVRDALPPDESNEGLLFPEMQLDGFSKEDKIKAKALLILIEKQGYRCALSGVPLDPETAAVDHIVPVSRGGPHDMTNVQILHEHVNQAKRNMLPEEFIEMCVNVAKHAGRL